MIADRPIYKSPPSHALQQNAELAGGHGIKPRRNFRLSDAYRHLHVRIQLDLGVQYWKYGALQRQR